MKKRLLFVLLLSFVFVQPVYAQGQTVPVFDNIPDIIEYVSFVAPQCETINGQQGIWVQPPEPVFPGMTLDIGLYFAWIVEVAKTMLRDNVCWLLMMVQHLANFLASLANALIFVLNYIAKLIISLWFHLRNFLYDIASELDEIRFFIHQVVGTTVVFAKNAWALFEEIANIIWLTVLSIIRLIVFLGVIITESINLLLQAVGSDYATSVSVDGGSLASTQCTENVDTSLLSTTHPLFYFVRGMLDGYRDSAIGWTFWVLVALAYIKAIIVFARYLPTGQGVSSE